MILDCYVRVFSVARKPFIIKPLAHTYAAWSCWHRDCRADPEYSADSEQRLFMPRAVITLLLAVLLLAGCHDARRESPLDPELTPATALAAVLLDSTGVVQLTWETYTGDTDLAEWWVLRNEANSLLVDTLARVQPGTTPAFADSTAAPDTRYEYRVSVVNTQGFETPSVRSLVAGYSLEPVRSVAAAPEPAAALIRLSWPTYSGPGFEAYLLFRHEPGRDHVDTLMVADDVTVTAFDDTSALHNVTYSYNLQTVAAGQRLDGSQVEARLQLAAPVTESLTLDSAEATALLRWAPYTGPHFLHYVISRRSQGQTADTLASIADLAQVEYIDSQLIGNAEYLYKLSVETDRDERIAAPEISGAFHQLVHSFQIDIDPNGALADSARAYGQEFNDRTGPPVFARLTGTTDGVDAYVSASNAVRSYFSQLDWRSYSRSGELRSRTYLADLISHGALFDQITRTARTNTALVLGDSILLAVLDPISGGFEVRQADANGQGRHGETVLLEIPLDTTNGQSPSGTGPLFYGGDREADAYTNFYAASVVVEGEEAFRSPFQSTLGGNLQLSLDIAWHNLELRQQHSIRFFKPEAFRFGVSLGGATLGRLSYWVNQSGPGDGWIDLEWTYTDPDDSTNTVSTKATLPWRSLGLVSQHLTLEARDGVGRLIDTTPVFVRHPVDPSLSAVSMALAEDGFAVVVGNVAYRLPIDGGSAEELRHFGARVTEVRTWRNRLGLNGGVALPDERRILVGSARGTDWSARLTNFVGPIIPVGAGTMLYPLSFDVGPDGRYYVLDAGASQVHVFDVSRRYITSFGEKGTGSGQFDFGTWGLDDLGDPGFSGSIAVDDEGYIYVSDGDNLQRVQVFAP